MRLALFATLVCAGGESAAQQLSSPPTIAPPRVETRVEATYPETERAAMKHAEVLLFVTVARDGRVSEASVERTSGAAFDEAALAAVRQWRFSPAIKEGLPVAARIRVAFHFAPPSVAPPSVAPQPLLAPEASPPGASSPPPAAADAAASKASATEIVVVGQSHVPSRGAGDYDIPVGKLALVPRRDAASLLRLAPGILLTNEGGVGHPYQIFLRGFDAREGQDIELTVDGIPINEVGNPHGNGLADTHFIIPELVRTLRVIEGPFAPQQGNFAVAGSALYDLGVSTPGLTAQVTAGSFGTKRLLLVWRPDGDSDHTFGGAEVFRSDGFGANRAAERASAMAGYETALGSSGSLRLLGTTYAAHYQQAGVLRLDDVESGRKGCYDTYDTSQGGDSLRHSVGATVEGRFGQTRVTQAAFLILRDFRLRQNLTGFQQDPQETWQSLHSQRGDLIDQQSATVTFGGRGSARRRWKALGQSQDFELGYFARYDRVDATQTRDRAGTTVPYRTNLDLASGLTNIGVYADASLKPLSWVTLRGGARFDFYQYLVTNRCALTSQSSFGGDPLDTEASLRTGWATAVPSKPRRHRPRSSSLARRCCSGLSRGSASARATVEVRGASIRSTSIRI
jgi:TonB family protein